MKFIHVVSYVAVHTKPYMTFNIRRDRLQYLKGSSSQNIYCSWWNNDCSHVFVSVYKKSLLMVLGISVLDQDELMAGQ